MIALGIPHNLNISFKKMLTICIAFYVDFTGMKCVDFDNLSTTTKIESFFFLTVRKNCDKIHTNDLPLLFQNG